MSDDTIKRSDAIKALYKYSFVSKDVIEREIQAIPSADRPQGEWHFDEKGNFFCSECKSYPRSQFATTDFCPKCGAKMKDLWVVKGADDERVR